MNSLDILTQFDFNLPSQQFSKNDIRKYFAESTLHRFKENLPAKILYGNGKRISGLLSKEQGISYPYVKPNSLYSNKYIIFDIDIPYISPEVQNNDILSGTFSVIDKDTGCYHSYFEIKNALPIPKHQSKATKAILSDIIDGYRLVLSADKVIIWQKQLSKNPLSDNWDVDVNGSVYSLSQLAEMLPTKPQLADLKALKGDMHVNSDGRNCTLFDSGREYAYKIARTCKDEAELYSKVFDLLVAMNETEVPKKFKFKGKLPYSELTTIAGSISRWTWVRKDTLSKKGVMGLDERQPLRIKQSIGAYYSHEVRTQNTQEKITRALMVLSNKGIETPTQMEIAKIAGIGQKTVSRYFKKHEERHTIHQREV